MLYLPISSHNQTGNSLMGRTYVFIHLCVSSLPSRYQILGNFPWKNESSLALEIARSGSHFSLTHRYQAQPWFSRRPPPPLPASRSLFRPLTFLQGPFRPWVQVPRKPTTPEPYLSSILPPSWIASLDDPNIRLYLHTAGCRPWQEWTGRRFLSFPGRRVWGKSVYQATPYCSQRWWLNRGRNACVASQAASY